MIIVFIVCFSGAHVHYDQVARQIHAYTHTNNIHAFGVMTRARAAQYHG